MHWSTHVHHAVSILTPSLTGDCATAVSQPSTILSSSAQSDDLPTTQCVSGASPGEQHNVVLYVLQQ